MGPNGIGLMANAQLMAGVAGQSFIELPWDPPEWTPKRRDFMLTEAIEPDAEGRLVMPDRPGLGIELDEEVLRRTRIEDGIVKSNN